LTPAEGCDGGGLPALPTDFASNVPLVTSAAETTARVAGDLEAAAAGGAGEEAALLLRRARCLAFFAALADGVQHERSTAESDAGGEAKEKDDSADGPAASDDKAIPEEKL
jgi:hypothetical protein